MLTNKFYHIFFIALLSLEANSELSSAELAAKTSINLMWINFNKSEELNDFVFPEPYVRSLSKSVPKAKEIINSFNRVELWALLNPASSIKIWYDATLVSKNAVQNTMAKLQSLEIAHQIELIDINERLGPYRELFNHELPIYFRVDLLRLIATYQTLISSPPNTFFAYFDWSVDPMRLYNIFAFHKSSNTMNHFGVIVGETEFNSFENSFHVMGNNKPNLLRALEGAIINKNLRRARMPETIAEQRVYGDYIGLFHVFHALEGNGQIEKITSEDPFKLDSSKTYLPLSEAEIEALLKIERVEDLLPLKSGDLSSDYHFQAGQQLKERFGDKVPIPTRTGISKPSKLSL